ncbi:odorant receptor 131-2-like [Polymixia lowei]
MADNNSAQSVGGNSSVRQINERVIIVQLLVVIFLYINFLLIITFSKKECFRTNMRYIFFANTLISDCFFLILTNILLILSYFRVPMQVWLCLPLCIASSLCTFITPVTLTAMTLERYVAICLPLRHGELCTQRNALHCILIMFSLSSIPASVTLSTFFSIITHSYYTQVRICSVELFIIQRWQSHVRSAVSQFYFLMMSVTIAVSYVKIMKVAKIASGENKKSTWKGLRTVVLHGFQLLLCLIQLWSPFIEAAVYQIDFMLYINVRYFNYIVFILAPRCLSPLVYGLRDTTFFLELKYYAVFGLYKKNTSVFVD